MTNPPRDERYVKWREACQRAEAEGKTPPSYRGFRLNALQRFNDGDVSPMGDKCPRCGAADRQIKIGKNASGSQRLKCQHCNVKYTPINTDFTK